MQSIVRFQPDYETYSSGKRMGLLLLTLRRRIQVRLLLNVYRQSILFMMNPAAVTLRIYSDKPAQNHPQFTKLHPYERPSKFVFMKLGVHAAIHSSYKKHLRRSTWRMNRNENGAKCLTFVWVLAGYLSTHASVGMTSLNLSRGSGGVIRIIQSLSILNSSELEKPSLVKLALLHYVTRYVGNHVV